MGRYMSLLSCGHLVAAQGSKPRLETQVLSALTVSACAFRLQTCSQSETHCQGLGPFEAGRELRPEARRLVSTWSA